MSRLSISNSSHAPRRRDHLAGEDVLVRGLVGGLLEVDARRADELGDDDALGAVDDEGALVGHQREVAHEDRLALDLAGLVVHELGGDEQRRGVRDVAVLALVDGVLRRLEAVVAERQRHRAGEVLDRGDLLEDLLETGLGVDIGPTLGQGRRRRGARQASLPTSQSKESICRSSRSGTSRGSAIFAKEIRPVVETSWVLRGSARGGQQWSFRDSQYLVVALRMTNGPCQVKRVVKMARANPNSTAEGRAKSRTRAHGGAEQTKSLAARNGSILVIRSLTRRDEPRARRRVSPFGSALDTVTWCPSPGATRRAHLDR